MGATEGGGEGGGGEGGGGDGGDAGGFRNELELGAACVLLWTWLLLWMELPLFATPQVGSGGGEVGAGRYQERFVAI